MLRPWKVSLVVVAVAFAREGATRFSAVLASRLAQSASAAPSRDRR